MTAKLTEKGKTKRESRQKIEWKCRFIYGFSLKNNQKQLLPIDF